jgi:hypothetical protein
MFMEDFDIISPIANIETIAIGNSIRELPRLVKFYGNARWRKLKGFASIRYMDGSTCHAELHWYEAHGIGRKEIKIKRTI